MRNSTNMAEKLGFRVGWTRLLPITRSPLDLAAEGWSEKEERSAREDVVGEIPLDVGRNYCRCPHPDEVKPPPSSGMPSIHRSIISIN